MTSITKNHTWNLFITPCREIFRGNKSNYSTIKGWIRMAQQKLGGGGGMDKITQPYV
jgi:hypothetical protein